MGRIVKPYSQTYNVDSNRPGLKRRFDNNETFELYPLVGGAVMLFLSGRRCSSKYDER
jgi:hypothetical protein